LKQLLSGTKEILQTQYEPMRAHNIEFPNKGRSPPSHCQRNVMGEHKMRAKKNIAAI